MLSLLFFYSHLNFTERKKDNECENGLKIFLEHSPGSPLSAPVDDFRESPAHSCLAITELLSQLAAHLAAQLVFRTSAPCGGLDRVRTYDVLVV